jgi:NADH:ubiquinone oxidoreductase subunit C
MTTQEALEKAEGLLQPVASGFTRPAADRLDAVIAASELPRAARALRDARFGYLSAITGLDWPPIAAKGETPAQPGFIEAMYHFSAGAAIVTLRVKVPYEAATIPSVCDVIPAATLYERELVEMLGVTVTGTPVTERFLLPDDWPDGVYPLRKSFTTPAKQEPGVQS